MTLTPKPGFDPLLIRWGAPDEVVDDKCSYCDAAIDDDDVPLRIWNDAGWGAVFCDHCMVKWWGFSGFR